MSVILMANGIGCERELLPQIWYANQVYQVVFRMRPDYDAWTHEKLIDSGWSDLMEDAYVLSCVYKESVIWLIRRVGK